MNRFNQFLDTFYDWLNEHWMLVVMLLLLAICFYDCLNTLLVCKGLTK